MAKIKGRHANTAETSIGRVNLCVPCREIGDPQMVNVTMADNA
jgi:hypothetical protein